MKENDKMMKASSLCLASFSFFLLHVSFGQRCFSGIWSHSQHTASPYVIPMSPLLLQSLCSDKRSSEVATTCQWRNRRMELRKVCLALQSYEAFKEQKHASKRLVSKATTASIILKNKGGHVLTVVLHFFLL